MIFGCRRGICVGFGGFWFVDVDLVAAGAVVGVRGASALFAGRQMFVCDCGSLLGRQARRMRGPSGACWRGACLASNGMGAVG